MCCAECGKALSSRMKKYQVKYLDSRGSFIEHKIVCAKCAGYGHKLDPRWTFGLIQFSEVIHDRS